MKTQLAISKGLCIYTGKSVFVAEGKIHGVTCIAEALDRSVAKANVMDMMADVRKEYLTGQYRAERDYQAEGTFHPEWYSANSTALKGYNDRSHEIITGEY